MNKERERERERERFNNYVVVNYHDISFRKKKTFETLFLSRRFLLKVPPDICCESNYIQSNLKGCI